MLNTKNPIRQTPITKAIRQAERHLAKADPIMKQLIAQHGHCPLAERQLQPFHMLANSIISQQLSTKAAATIKAKAPRRGYRNSTNAQGKSAIGPATTTQSIQNSE
jgi:3-methyladenine DNA glycosylase/8-oxoguanine DNA glycosylase